MSLQIYLHLMIITFVANLVGCNLNSNVNKTSESPLAGHVNLNGAKSWQNSTKSMENNTIASIEFAPKALKINMYNISTIVYNIRFDQAAIKSNPSDHFNIVFTAITWSPQFDIVHLSTVSDINVDGSTMLSVLVTKKELAALNYYYSSSFNVTANYIGHANIIASLLFQDVNNSTTSSILMGALDVVSFRTDGLLELIFKLSAVGVVVVNFFNIGTQLDSEKMSNLLSSPRITLTSFLVTLIAMPLIAYSAGYWLVRDQINYWFGAFLVGTCPAASSASLYVLMLRGNQELAVTLQLISTITATLTMPLWMMTLGATITEDRFAIKVPYLTLVGTMLLLLQALAFGYSVGKCSKRLSQFVARFIRPFTIIAVSYLVLFSIIAYWFVFKMFDMRLILLGAVISSATYALSALMAGVFRREIKHMSTVAVISSYKNTGIAFAVLLVAMENPDCYIAFIPCLTQILSSVVIIYSQVTVLSIYDRIKKSNGINKSSDNEISNSVESDKEQEKFKPVTTMDDINVASIDDIEIERFDNKIV